MQEECHAHLLICTIAPVHRQRHFTVLQILDDWPVATIRPDIGVDHITSLPANAIVQYCLTVHDLDRLNV